MQNTVYPSIGIAHVGSTVRYSRSGDQDVLGLSYYNLSIQGTGNKTLNNTAYVSNLVDVGDGTNATMLTVPSTHELYGTVDVLNAGTLDLQNTIIPTLGNLSSGSTVRYSGTTDQDVLGTAYANLQIYGTGNKTLTGPATVSTLTTVGDGTNTVTFSIPDTNALTGTGPVNVSNNGILDIKTLTLPTLGTLAVGSTVRYSYVGNQDVIGTVYYNMEVDNSYVKTMQNDVKVTNINFANAGTLALNNYTLHLNEKDIAFYSPNAIFSQLSVSVFNDQVAGLSINRQWATSGTFTNTVDITFSYPDTENNSTTIGAWYRGDSGIWTKIGTFTATPSGGYMY
ncbi:MAG: hypothetical protein Q8M66_01675, partial [Actinomycetota bacterium]|nr:hypothetical protein [Actinomycetota bacterium]